MSEPEPTLIDVLDGCLTTESGQNIPETMIDINDSLSRIALSMENLNKILIKMLSQMSIKTTDTK